jgi:outer membrane protein assembly factor BamD
LLLLSLFLLAACATKPAPTPAQNAGTYFKEGEAFFEQGLYKDAIDSWEKVRDSYFSPELNILAELKIAEAHFLAEEYIEAAVAYESFLQSHPDHPRAADALYLLGLSYNHQILAPDQDQTATISALHAFQTLLQRFPEDPRKREVQIYIDRCNNQLAVNEVNIGSFYLKTKYYSAAISRFEGVLKKYPNYFQRDKAYFYLGQAYALVGDSDKSSLVFNILFNEYANSEYTFEARKFIEKNQ